MTKRTTIPDAQTAYRADVLKIFALARDMLVQTDTVPKHLMVIGADGALTMAHVGDLDSPRQVSAVVLKLWQETQATRIYFFGEAWTITLDPGDQFIRPADSDRRRECLIVSAFDRQLGYQCGMQMFDRDEAAKPIFNQEVVMHDMSSKHVDRNLGVLAPFLQSSSSVSKVN